MNSPVSPPVMARGSVIEFVSKPGKPAHPYVLLTDPALALTLEPSRRLGAVLLTQKTMPPNTLYPQIVGRSGSTGSNIRGMWRARPDRIVMIDAPQITWIGMVSGQELADIDAAVRTFLGV